ncbi:MAG: hypothetical protein DRP54_05040 [Spirochaetes bacterium]|nr:MAG: hypothetical protein DRP54_05040 [Spirochaetota bacterium]
MAHLKRHAMPKWWPVPRKTHTFVVKPMPGPHPWDKSVPLKIIIRDILGYAENSYEAKKILTAGKVLVDKKVRKEPNFPVGFMDVIEIPETKKFFRMDVNEKGMGLREISEKESGMKLCKIIGKTVVKGGLFQINLHDGRNIILKRNMYNVGDSLLIG